MKKALEIIQKYEDLPEDGDEIEIDFDLYKTKTLRDLLVFLREVVPDKGKNKVSTYQ